MESNKIPQERITSIIFALSPNRENPMDVNLLKMFPNAKKVVGFIATSSKRKSLNFILRISVQNFLSLMIGSKETNLTSPIFIQKKARVRKSSQIFLGKERWKSKSPSHRLFSLSSSKFVLTFSRKLSF